VVSNCRIDCTVGPASGTRSGSLAGYRGWGEFKAHGLSRYAELRNTGDSLWDAAQASFRIHGELHNNLRITWGKALLQWTPSPEEALRTMIDLNHRYALDGSDPNSIGGILWCLYS
jgi:deoxyribodipyrimidine photolyase